MNQVILLYKCRRCGNQFETTMTTHNSPVAMLSILTNQQATGGTTALHKCGLGIGLGVGDLIGAN